MTGGVRCIVGLGFCWMDGLAGWIGWIGWIVVTSRAWFQVAAGFTRGI